jgi:HSP20 family protein
MLQSTRGETESRNGAEQFTLPVDIRHGDGAFTVEASVPGFEPENVEVTVESGVFSIKGTYDDQRDNREGYVRRERCIGSVYRQIALPAEARR